MLQVREIERMLQGLEWSTLELVSITLGMLTTVPVAAISDTALVALVAAVSTLLTAFLTQILAPYLKRRIGGDIDFRHVEFTEAMKLRREWQDELKEVKKENRELRGRCDKLEDQVATLQRVLMSHGIEPPELG